MFKNFLAGSGANGTTVAQWYGVKRGERKGSQGFLKRGESTGRLEL
jgi:hypothetical protein